MPIPCKLCGLWLLLFVSLVLSACDSRDKQKQKTGKAVFVEVAEVIRAPIKTRRIVTGTLEAATDVKIFNEEPGRLITLPYYEGDKVKQGDILARIDDSLLQSELNKATASLKQAQQDLRRLKRLVSRKLASEDELSRALTAVQQTEAEVELLQNRINRSLIRAPFDGVISERLREPGDVVPLYSHILTIIDPSYLKAEIHLSELLVTHVTEGQPVSLRIDALGEQEYPAEVSRIHPTINPSTRQGIIEVRLQPIPAGAKPGQLCRVTIQSRSTPRLSIPFPSLRHDNTGEFVYRVDKNSVIRKIRVESGIQLADRVEIIDGLKLGDRIVAKGFIGLRDGVKVAVTNPAEPKPSS